MRWILLENELYTNWKENISIANEEIVLETDTCLDVKVSFYSKLLRTVTLVKNAI